MERFDNTTPHEIVVAAMIRLAEDRDVVTKRIAIRTYKDGTFSLYVRPINHLQNKTNND